MWRYKDKTRVSYPDIAAPMSLLAVSLLVKDHAGLAHAMNTLSALSHRNEQNLSGVIGFVDNPNIRPFHAIFIRIPVIADELGNFATHVSYQWRRDTRLRKLASQWPAWQAREIAKLIDGTACSGIGLLRRLKKTRWYRLKANSEGRKTTLVAKTRCTDVSINTLFAEARNLRFHVF